MWPSGDCIDRFPAIGVTLLAHLRMTTRGNSVLRLNVASLNHWLFIYRRHPLACCYVFWIRHVFSDRRHARACIHPSRALLSWHEYVLNQRHVRGLRCYYPSTPPTGVLKLHQYACSKVLALC